METIAISAFYDLVLEGVPPGGLDLDDDYCVSTNKEIASDVAEQLKSVAGSIMLERLLACSSYACVFKRSPEESIDETTALAFLQLFTTKSHLLLLALWLMRDNGANSGPTFLILKSTEGWAQDFQSENRSSWYVNAECQSTPTTYSREELDRAIDYWNQFDSVIPKVRFDPASPRISGLVHRPRIVRALYFIQGARGATDIGVKLAFYCICFESLFTTDSIAVGHKVAERVAVFLEHGGLRRDVYRNVKRIYDERSKVVHGNPLKERDLPRILELARLADDYLRRCVRQILDDAEMLDVFSRTSDKALQEHFLNTLFPE